ncbi:MAG TPA: efflux RND transporter permease subunit [Phycisphaerae bacterium]|nr:efflux RND transporter permease subunit [Phycisphaerae bacterium]
MWIVRLALRRPYTFVVAALLVIILGIYEITQMPTDIFPVIDIPVVSVVFNYTGMSPQEMEQRIVSPYERILTTTVNDIEHIESQSLNGVSVTKIYFQKNAKIDVAISQITAISQTATRMMPPGTQPPLIIQYNASSVPILELSIGSDTMPEQDLFDQAVNFLRPQLITIPGVQIPYPYGGKMRNVIVDLDPDKLYAYGISPADVSNAVNAQNLILPAGTTKIGKQEYPVLLNSTLPTPESMNAIPIKSVNGTTIYLRDVAHVRDGFAVQTNVVHANGKRGVLQPILKAGNASTLSVVQAVLDKLPQIRESLPKELQITPMFDQSIFVRASVWGVVKEAAIAASLTALMILLFLGSWRSTLIVMLSIPLSIFVSIIVLSFLGETLNVMTLGGMALAVGILVDDATVEIENVHRNLHQRKRLVQAILDGASQIAVPAFVSTLCICIVFVPVVFISGAAKYLFTPLAMAVVFAMMTSYLLSRTLVPTLVHYLLAAEVEQYGGVIDTNDPHAMHALHAQEAKSHGQQVPDEDIELPERLRLFFTSVTGILATVAFLILLAAAVFALGYSPVGAWAPSIHGLIVDTVAWSLKNTTLLAEVGLGAVALALMFWLVLQLHRPFNWVFEKLQRTYGGFLEWALAHRSLAVSGFVAFVILSCCLYPFIGTDFFPSVDAGQIRLHVRCPAGTRIEETAQRYARVEDAIRKIIPAADISTVLDNMGIPNSAINLSLSDGSIMSPADGEILIALKENHRPTADYTHALRKELTRQFPDLTFFFAPADIVTQVLNFGLPAPVDVQIAGLLPQVPHNEGIAENLVKDLSGLPGIVDVHLAQVPKTPDLRVNVDRTLASLMGVSQRDVASDLLISLSSSNQTSPNYWVDPRNGVQYSVYVQTPQYNINSMNDLENTPVVPTSGDTRADNAQLLVNLSSTERGFSATNVTHYNIRPTFDVEMGVQGVDLGTAGKEIDGVVNKYRGQLQGGSRANLLGQIQSMNASFSGLGYGLIFAVVLVYLLMVINFQSWLDPLIILMALPGAIAGILWMLWASHTTISVPALMGAIMSIGVATANSILMITFANDQRLLGMNAHDAALSAGITRLRPVMMTALAMIIGMLPMALGLGEGGEQNAPLGRAVIGGLSMATFATLVFVPVVYSILRRKARETHVEKELM